MTERVTPRGGARDGGVVQRIWRGDSMGMRTIRSVLTPLSWIYAGAMRVRNLGFDTGVLRVTSGVIPAVSVGNLSVGGTGKTPVSAWIASELAARGARPAIVLRGYGDDEPLVHGVLNPAVPVIVAPDRVDGVARAAAAGANIAILDDAFQHRRAARDADLVLVSADAWSEPLLSLPAGPWRESLAALDRATAVIVTRKAVSARHASDVATRLGASRRPVAIVHLAADELRRLGHEERRPLASLGGLRVLAIAAIGDPAAFAAQLAGAGASVILRAFADHHAFTPADIAALAAEGREAELVVCTLKDAVKLVPRWPDDRVPLWYVSQRVVQEAGQEVLARLLDDLLSLTRRARTAGSGRPQSPSHGH